MLNEYLIENLVIGKLVTVHNLGGSAATIPTTMGPFIFNKIPTEKGKKQRYQEVFTEDVYKESKSSGSQKFGKTYIVVVDSLANYLTEEELEKKQISKTRVLEIYTNVVKQEFINEQVKEKSKIKRK